MKQQYPLQLAMILINQISRHYQEDGDGQGPDIPSGFILNTDKLENHSYTDREVTLPTVSVVEFGVIRRGLRFSVYLSQFIDSNVTPEEYRRRYVLRPYNWPGVFAHVFPLECALHVQQAIPYCRKYFKHEGIL